MFSLEQTTVTLPECTVWAFSEQKSTSSYSKWVPLLDLPVGSIVNKGITTLVQELEECNKNGFPEWFSNMLSVLSIELWSLSSMIKFSPVFILWPTPTSTNCSVVIGCDIVRQLAGHFVLLMDLTGLSRTCSSQTPRCFTLIGGNNGHRLSTSHYIYIMTQVCWHFLTQGQRITAW